MSVMKPTILLLGGTGYIGSAFAEVLQSSDYRWKILRKAEGVDYRDMRSLKNFLDLHKNHHALPTANCVVINCSGYTGKPNVDRCELYKDDTILGNVVLPAQLSEVLASRGIPLLHVSSGCIYNSDAMDDTTKYSETDRPNFSFESDRHNWKSHQPKCSFYSGSKALGEEVVYQNNPFAYICRLRIPFDEYDSPRNYISKLLTYDKLLNAFNSFSHRYDFVHYCLELINCKAEYGVYNVTNEGNLCTKEVVDMIQHYIPSNKKWSFYEGYDEFFKDVTSHRSNCTLDVSKLKKYMDVRSVQVAMDSAISHFQKNKI